MSRVAFKQAEVERLLRAAKAVGYLHPTVEKRADGTLVLLTGKAAEQLSDLERARAERERYRAAARS